jgi:DNA-binding transcriptional LysR family regulator
LRHNPGILLEILPRRADRGMHRHARTLIVTSDRSRAPDDDDHRVIPFRPRQDGSGSRGWPWLLHASRPPPSPVEGLEKYEGGEQDDNYRHRMMVNLAALLFTVALAGAGVWLVSQIADLRKNQDCVLSGRRNCTPIDVNALER